MWPRARFLLDSILIARFYPYCSHACRCAVFITICTLSDCILHCRHQAMMGSPPPIMLSDCILHCRHQVLCCSSSHTPHRTIIELNSPSLHAPSNCVHLPHTPHPSHCATPSLCPHRPHCLARRIEDLTEISTNNPGTTKHTLACENGSAFNRVSLLDGGFPSLPCEGLLVTIV